MAIENTKEKPWGLGNYLTSLKSHLEKAPYFWIEGELISLNIRGSAAFFEIKDLQQDMQLAFCTFHTTQIDNLRKISTGARVVALARPTIFKSGRLTMSTQVIDKVGVGDLMLRLQMLKEQLTKEGLFDAYKKLPLPFLPRKIGLICGRDAKAKDDVLENVYKRWPAANFEIREVAVQGVNACSEVINAMHDLASQKEIDVLVIARGGGSFQDLLPFSDEELVRSVAKMKIPIVSAIGHEGDQPLLDLVADYRASTPTDAAKNIVPDIYEQMARINDLSEYLQKFVTNKFRLLNSLLTRPVLSNPLVVYQTKFDQLYLKLESLSPNKIMMRGFSVVTNEQNKVITDAKQLENNQKLQIKFAKGKANVKVNS